MYICSIQTNKNYTTMTNLLNKIENLENKQANGTITMCEESTLCELVELAEKIIYKQ